MVTLIFLVITKLTLDKLKRMFLERLKYNRQSYMILDDNISFSKQPEKNKKKVYTEIKLADLFLKICHISMLMLGGFIAS